MWWEDQKRNLRKVHIFCFRNHFIYGFSIYPKSKITIFESAYDFLNFNHLQSSFLTPNLFQNTGLKNIFLEYQVEVVQHSFLKKFIRVSEIESFSSSSQKRKDIQIILVFAYATWFTQQLFKMNEFESSKLQINVKV